jgi:hypothetical protein
VDTSVDTSTENVCLLFAATELDAPLLPVAFGGGNNNLLPVIANRARRRLRSRFEAPREYIPLDKADNLVAVTWLTKERYKKSPVS